MKQLEKLFSSFNLREINFKRDEYGKYYILIKDVHDYELRIDDCYGCDIEQAIKFGFILKEMGKVYSLKDYTDIRNQLKIR